MDDGRMAPSRPLGVSASNPMPLLKIPPQLPSLIANEGQGPNMDGMLKKTRNRHLKSLFLKEVSVREDAATWIRGQLGMTRRSAYCLHVSSSRSSSREVRVPILNM